MRWRLASTILFLFALPSMAREQSAVYVGTDRGLFWSKDGGNSWQQSAALGSRGVHAVGISSAKPSTLFAATAEEMFRSPDSGPSWEQVDVPDAARIRVILTDPATPERVYAAGAGLLVSTDGGRHCRLNSGTSCLSEAADVDYHSSTFSTCIVRVEPENWKESLIVPGIPSFDSSAGERS